MRLYLSLFILLALASCDEIFDFDVVGNGEVEVFRPNLGTQKFTKVILSSKFDLVITQWHRDSITIVTDSNLQPFIATTVTDGVLIIEVNDNKTLIPQNSITINLFIQEIASVENIGEGSVTIDSLSANTFSLLQSGRTFFYMSNCAIDSLYYLSQGAAYANIEGNFELCQLRQIGSGKIIMKGNSSKIKYVQEGSGEIDSYQLQALYADLQLYGSGLLFCRVSDLLKVKIDGDGKIFYKGMPKVESDLSHHNSLVREIN